LGSEYERADIIADILSLIIQDTYELFECDRIATKAIASAEERILALERLGFQASQECLVGHDGAKYGSYYIRQK